MIVQTLGSKISPHFSFVLLLFSLKKSKNITSIKQNTITILINITSVSKNFALAGSYRIDIVKVLKIVHNMAKISDFFTLSHGDFAGTLKLPSIDMSTEIT